MKPRTRELVEYGKLCGFVLEPELDGNTHYVMTHPNGGRVRVASTPGDRRGDDNTRAEMRRKSGVTPPRPNAGRYKKGVSHAPRYEPASVWVESRSRQIGLLQKEHRETCERIERCRASGDRDGARHAVSRLLGIEARFANLGVDAPLRRFRVWVDARYVQDKE